jgi:hypothetical protein
MSVIYLIGSEGFWQSGEEPGKFPTTRPKSCSRLEIAGWGIANLGINGLGINDTPLCF